MTTFFDKMSELNGSNVSENNQAQNNQINQLMLNAAIIEIHHEVIFKNSECAQQAQQIKNMLRLLINEDYNSQQVARFNTIETIVASNGDINTLIDKALAPTFGNDTYLTQIIHHCSLFLVCLAYPQSSLPTALRVIESNSQSDKQMLENKINIILTKISTKLSSNDFLSGTIQENKNITESLTARLNSNKNATQLVRPRRKPRYFVWSIMGSLVVGTGVGLYFYLKKK